MSRKFVYRVRIFAGSWIDITSDVRSVSITRRSTGATGERARLESGRCQIRLDNRSGNYSPRNPLGAYYGLLGRNTPIEVDAGRVGGTLVDRFYGEVPSWPPRWSLSGVDRYVDVDASGTISRSGQGTQPDWSPMRRTIEATNPVAYWPVEDGTLAEGAGSAGSGQGALTLDGVVDFKTIPDYQALAAGNVNRYGTTALADLSAGGSLSATLDPAGTAATAGGPWTVAIAGRTVAATLSANVVLLEWTTAGGTYTRFQLQITTLSRTQVIGYTAAGASTTLIDWGSASSGFAQHAVSASRSGTTVTISLWRQTSNTTPSTTATFSGTIGGITSLKVNPTGATSTGDMPFGHVVVWAASSPQVDFGVRADSWPPTFFVNESLRSWWGEDAGDRLERVAAEAGVTVSVVDGSDAYPTRMGFQQPSSLVPLAEESVDADGGMLYESRSSPDWVYRRRTSLYGQTPLTISYVGQTTAPLDPDDNTSTVRNDVTVKRLDGSSARVIKDTGPLTPALVRVQPDEVELNLLEDAQLPDQAGWRVHIGTVDELRYPAITVELASPEWQAAPALLDQLLALDVGGVLAVDQVPTWLAAQLGGRAPQILVTEYTETITEFVWSISFAGVPASPWDVATADGEQRVPADGSTLAMGVTDTDRVWSITSTAENGPWSVDPIDYPLDVRIGGEHVRADAPGWSLNNNPFMTGNASSWTGQAASLVWSPDGRPGTPHGAAVVTPNGAGIGGGIGTATAVTAGTAYRFVMWARVDVSPVDVGMAVDWSDAGGGFLSTTFVTSAVTLTVAAGWTSFVGSATAPAGAAFVTLRARHQGMPAVTAKWRFTEFSVSGAATATGVGAFQRLSCAPGGRGINGVQRAWPSGTEVDVWQPAIAPL